MAAKGARGMGGILRSFQMAGLTRRDLQLFEHMEQEKEIEALMSIQWLNTIDPKTTEEAGIHVLGSIAEKKAYQVQTLSFVAIIVKVPSFTNGGPPIWAKKMAMRRSLEESYRKEIVELKQKKENQREGLVKIK